MPIRAVLMLVSAGCLQRSLMSPTPVVAKENLVCQDGVHERLIMVGGTGHFVGYIMKGIAWTLSFIEIAVVLARLKLFPQIVNHTILSYLTGSTENMVAVHQLPFAVVAGASIAIAGTALRLSAFRTLGRHFTFQITLSDDHQLVTSYPYNIVRHPGYTGLYTVYLGLACSLLASDGWIRRVIVPTALNLGAARGMSARIFLVTLLVFHAVLLSSMVPRARDEDKLLHHRFGKHWEEWAQSVPFRIVPFVW